MTQTPREAAEAFAERLRDKWARMTVSGEKEVSLDWLADALIEFRTNVYPLPAAPSEPTAEGQQAREWRCFHCDEVFADIKYAREHFGRDEVSEPGCKLASHEGGLVGYIRKLENELDGYRREIDPISVSWHAREADHRRALIREEQRGYDKGLNDSRADIARMKAAMEELRSQIEPCGCSIGRCEQFPDKELLYYGRLCRRSACARIGTGSSIG